MIVSRTPLRMSFVGGGSDIPSFYSKHGGAVVSTAINKFVYIAVNKRFQKGVRVNYSRTEEHPNASMIEHPLIRNALELMEIRSGIDIAAMADIPSRGTGLGSSSAFTVGLLNALYFFKHGKSQLRTELARMACEVEIDRCGDPIGKQDQFACAVGGLNFIRFEPDGRVAVQPICCKSEVRTEIEAHCLLFYTELEREATVILREQQQAVAADPKKESWLQEMALSARRLREDLENGRTASFPAMLRRNWELKSRLADSITNPRINDYLERAYKAGALAGKILGAGGGGFLLIYAPPSAHGAIKKALPELRSISFRFENTGSQITSV